jgi:REP element-mobilizing transposase RayT
MREIRTLRATWRGLETWCGSGSPAQAGAPVLDPTAQNVERKMRNFLGHKFWARGYFVTTVGRDEEVIRAYIKNQELADQQLDQFELKISAAPKSNQSS